MLNFEEYVGRYGEHGVQALIEGIERRERIKFHIEASLEERWNLLMNDVQPVVCIPQALAA